jgi:uncharacterized membrane protein
MMRLSRLAFAGVIVSELGLIGGLLWWCGPLAGALLSLPLLAALPSLLRGNLYTAKWASLLLVFYIAGLLAESYAIHTRHAIGMALSVVATVEFVSLLLFVRWSAREAQAKAG